MKNRFKKFYHDHEKFVFFTAWATGLGAVIIVAKRFDTPDLDMSEEEYDVVYRALNPELFPN